MQSDCGARAEQNRAHRHRQFRAPWREAGRRGMAGICDHRPVDRCALRQEALQAVSDQHRLSAGLLSGDGRDSGGMAALIAAGFCEIRTIWQKRLVLSRLYLKVIAKSNPSPPFSGWALRVVRGITWA